MLTIGWQVASWIETLLCHGPGDVEGTAIEFDDEFLAAIARMYELHPTGRRKLRRYVLSRAKGRAKSELAGAIVCAEALGPVRFSHWAKRGETAWWGYEFEKGEPVGKPVTYPFIRCLATEEGQAGNTYDNVQFMLTEGPIAGEIAGLDVGLTRTFLPRGGEIRPSTAGSSSKDGGKETFVVPDELHLYVLPELHRMYATVARNLVKRKAAEPWMLATSTMFRPGEGSVAELLWTARQDELEGRRKPDPTAVWDHKEGPEPARWGSNSSLRAALRVAYGPAAAWMDLDKIVAEIRDPLTDGADARRYFLNRHAPPTHQGWLKDHPGAWDRCAAPELDIVDGSDVAVGIDVSLNHDASAIAVAANVDGRVVVRSWVWEPAGGVVDHLELMEFVRGLAVRWHLTGVAYDPRFWELPARMLADDGLPMVEVAQSPERMTPQCGRLLELIVNGTLAHDGNDQLRRHVLAAEKRVNDRGFTLSKGKSRGHIDACIATALACWELEQDAQVGKPVFAY